MARGGGADASSWERGARAPGDGLSGGTPFSSFSQPSSRAAAAAPPQPMSTGNVMDWRGLGGRGASGRGGGRGRGDGRGRRDGGGRGGGGRQGGGRGRGGLNSIGGMDRRR